MFQLHEVSKVYARRGREVLAFHAPSLTIARGSYVAVVGPSGSGKTTLLSMLGGMLSPNTGKVTFHGNSLYELTVADRAQWRREKIGFVFQSFNLVPYLSAVENVEVPLYLAGVSPAEQRERSVALLERVGLGERLDHKPCELSVGQQQRVALARTMANRPQVILADEPTGSLDPDSREHVLKLFDDVVATGGTVVMVTHDPAAAARARQVFQLKDGSIVPTTADALRQAA